MARRREDVTREQHVSNLKCRVRSPAAGEFVARHEIVELAQP